MPCTTEFQFIRNLIMTKLEISRRRGATATTSSSSPSARRDQNVPTYYGIGFLTVIAIISIIPLVRFHISVSPRNVSFLLPLYHLFRSLLLLACVLVLIRRESIFWTYLLLRPSVQYALLAITSSNTGQRAKLNCTFPYE